MSGSFFSDFSGITLSYFRPYEGPQRAFTSQEICPFIPLDATVFDIQHKTAVLSQANSLSFSQHSIINLGFSLGLFSALRAAWLAEKMLMRFYLYILFRFSLAHSKIVKIFVWNTVACEVRTNDFFTFGVICL